MWTSVDSNRRSVFGFDGGRPEGKRAAGACCCEVLVEGGRGSVRSGGGSSASATEMPTTTAVQHANVKRVKRFDCRMGLNRRLRHKSKTKGRTSVSQISDQP